MKKYNVAKRLGIASLCLATAFSAFSGIASLGENVALAESSATDFVHTTVADENVTINENGLLIESDEAYNATFKAVFTGNTTLNFRFPETITNEDGNATHPDSYYGEFRIKITDATDDSNSFYIRFLPYTTGNTYVGTAAYVHHAAGNRKVDRSGNMLSKNTVNSASYFCGPFFLGYTGNAINSSSWSGQYNKEGSVSLVWDANGVLSVKSYTVNKSNWTQRVFAAFDGTDTFDATAKTWGLPKLSFPNGYKITVSSNLSTCSPQGLAFDTSATKFVDSNTVSDMATDVLISSITSDNATYDFKTMTEYPNDTQTQQFDNLYAVLEEQPTAAGKAFLGWKNTTTSALYPANSLVRKTDTYEPVVIDYDTVNGASVRIAVGGQSGIRFQTMFKAEDYEAVKDYIDSFGTLIAWTETLETVGKDFTIANYKDETSFKQVESVRGLFNYTAGGTAYKAYTVAIVNIPVESYTVAYSARGYLVVKYVDGSTKAIYTDYNATNNSRSIAEAAHNLRTLGATEYGALSTAQKTIIDAYADAYVAE